MRCAAQSTASGTPTGHERNSDREHRLDTRVGTLPSDLQAPDCRYFLDWLLEPGRAGGGGECYAGISTVGSRPDPDAGQGLAIEAAALRTHHIVTGWNSDGHPFPTNSGVQENWERWSPLIRPIPKCAEIDWDCAIVRDRV
jgi:hypothetical protein